MNDPRDSINIEGCLVEVPRAYLMCDTHNIDFIVTLQVDPPGCTRGDEFYPARQAVLVSVNLLAHCLLTHCTQLMQVGRRSSLRSVSGDAG